MNDRNESRELVIDAIEEICAQPSKLAAVAEGNQINTTVAAWQQDVPRQDAADKVTTLRC